MLILLPSHLSFFCSFVMIRPVHGLVFLFKWKPGEEPAGPIVHESRSLGIFFAKQVRFGTFSRRMENPEIQNPEPEPEPEPE